YFGAIVFGILFDTMLNFERYSIAIGAFGTVNGVLHAILIRHLTAEIPMFIGSIFMRCMKILIFFLIQIIISFFLCRFQR
ncbi:MAG: rhomboid family intramembrane serine protease, partial [Thermoplasmata archaeon]